jgi:hypothetical protein
MSGGYCRSKQEVTSKSGAGWAMCDKDMTSLDEKWLEKSNEELCLSA